MNNSAGYLNNAIILNLGKNFYDSLAISGPNTQDGTALGSDFHINPIQASKANLYAKCFT